VLVDGAHAPGQIALDIASLGVDWYAGNCHKWLFAPRGCGFLWAHPRAQASLHPLQISHGYGQGLAAEFDWPGTRDFSAWLAVPDALDFFRRIKPRSVHTHNHRLVTSAARRIAAAWGTPLDGPPGLHGAMMAVRLPECWQGKSPKQIADFFARRGIFIAIAPIGGALWARISAQVYNTPQDYARLLEAGLP
jgi:isopenicillin-N epimerase